MVYVSLQALLTLFSAGPFKLLEGKFTCMTVSKVDNWVLLSLQVTFCAHVHLPEQRPRNVHDLNE